MALSLDRLLPREKASPLFDADGNELPGLRDRGVWLLLLFVLLLEFVAWHYAEGYPIADSVEFMERARTLVRGERIIDSGQIRPFGFSLLIAPIYLLADWIGLLDPRPVLWAICLLQIGCGLLLVFVCVRLGARLGGRRTGLVAGFLVGTNPAFLTYCAMPISGIFAAVCIGLGLESLWQRGNARREWIGALWLAAALLMIYQCALVVATIAACILLRDRLRAWRPLRTLALALLFALALQSLVDRLVYGSFGASLQSYLVVKGGGLLSSMLMRMGSVLHLSVLKGWAVALGRAAFSSQAAIDSAAQSAQELHSKQPFDWYLTHLPQMLVWPVLFLFACALWKALRRPNWMSSFLWLALLFNLTALTLNPSKEFRLWLPLLPFVAPLCASGGQFGWSAFEGRASENVFWRRVFSVAMAGATAYLALMPFLHLNRREFGGYWQAMDFVDGLAQDSYPSRRAQAERSVAGAPPPRVRVGFDYNWSVFQRESPLIDLVKLPSQLSLWSSGALDAERKRELLAALPELDILVVHQPILTTNPDLFEWVSLHFQVCGALYDQRTYEPTIGPIFVLSQRRGSQRDSRFFDVQHLPESERFAGLAGLQPGREFAREDGSELLELLGWEYRRLPPEGLGWITYHWYSPTGLHTHWELLDRITSLDERNAWQGDPDPAWGTFPSESWAPETRVSESYLVVPSAEPYNHSLPYRPLGGGYRRGDLIPVRLWMCVVERMPADQSIKDRLQPRLRSPKEPLFPLGDGTFQSPDGTQWSNDDMVHVGNFFLDVQPAARLPDDGRPIPDGG